MRPVQIIIGAVVILTIAGGSFAAGLTVGRERAAATTAAEASASSGGAARRAGGSGSPNAQFGGGAGAFGGQAVIGRVIAVNDGSITIEVRQPGQQGASPSIGSQIVLVGASTRVVRTVEQDMKLADIKANDQVTIVGATDSNGIVSANAIVVGANALQQLFGGARPSASPSPRP